MVIKDHYEKALELHEKCIVIDTLSPGPPSYRVSSKAVEEIERLIDSGLSGWTVRLKDCEIKNNFLLHDKEFRDKYVAYWKKARVTTISDTVHSGGTHPSSYESGLAGVAWSIAHCDELEEIFIKVTKAEHIRRAKHEGKMGIIINFQDTTQIEGSLDKLELFYNLGVRIIQLTYNTRNLVGNGCMERTDGGLSFFGLKVVNKMNELGMLIDLSHCGKKTTIDAIEHSKQPCAVTHSFPRAFHDHPRGKTDEELKALADKGGYIGMCVVPSFLSKPTLDEWAKQVEHLVNIVGIDKVGIGTDYGGSRFKAYAELLQGDTAKMGWKPKYAPDYVGMSMEGYKDWREWPNLTASLVAQGFSDSEMCKILGENFLKLFKRVVK